MKKSVLLLFFAGCVAVKKMDYLSALFVMNYFCLGNTQRIICPAHGICLEMRENYVVPLIR